MFQGISVTYSLSFINLSSFHKGYNSFENLEAEKIQKYVKSLSSKFFDLMIKASILSSVLYLCTEFSSPPSHPT